MKTVLLAAALAVASEQAGAAVLYYNITGTIIGDAFALVGASDGDPFSLKIKVQTENGRISENGQAVFGNPYGERRSDIKRRSPTAWWLFTVGEETIGGDGGWQSFIVVTPTSAVWYTEAISEDYAEFRLTFAEIPGANVNSSLSTDVFSGFGSYNDFGLSFEVETFSISPPNFAPVPLPASAALMFGAIASLAGLRRLSRFRHSPRSRAT